MQREKTRVPELPARLQVCNGLVNRAAIRVEREREGTAYEREISKHCYTLTTCLY